MRTIVIAVAMSLCLVSLSAVATADTLVLRDGTRVEGTVVSFAARTITFRHADGVSRRYHTSQVAAVEFLSAERMNTRAANDRNLEAPAGTELVVHAVETIDSCNAGSDQAVSAVVEREITNATSHVVVTKGGDVHAPADTVLRFRLDPAVVFHPER